MKGRLNLFQASMLRWRELHPYNAVHVVRIERPLDAARLTAIIDAAARRARPHRSRARRRTPALRIHRRAGAGHACRPCRRRPADRRAATRRSSASSTCPSRAMAALNPFRFFCIDNGQWFHLGLAYDHVDRRRRLDRGPARRASSPAIPATGPKRRPPRPFDRYPATYRTAVLPPSRAPCCAGCRFLRAIAASCRRTVRPVYPRGGDHGNGFAYRRLDPPEFAALVAPRARGASPSTTCCSRSCCRRWSPSPESACPANAGTSSPSRRSSISGAISAPIPTRRSASS